MERDLLLPQDLLSLERELDVERRGSANAERVHALELQVAMVRRTQAELVQQFVEEYADKLRELAQRLVGPNDADDVAQNAFVNLVLRIRAKPLEEVTRLLKTPEELFKLMCRITSFRAFDVLRSRYANLADLTDDGEAIDFGGERSLPPHTAFDLRRLKQAYDVLSPAQRITHILHHYYGFTSTDIAKILKIREPTVRSCIHRATKALKRAMEKQQ